MCNVFVMRETFFSFDFFTLFLSSRAFRVTYATIQAMPSNSLVAWLSATRSVTRLSRNKNQSKSRSANLVLTCHPKPRSGRVHGAGPGAVQNSMDRPQVARVRGLGGPGAPQTREPRPFFVCVPSPRLALLPQFCSPSHRTTEYVLFPHPFSKRRTRRTPGPFAILNL